MLALRIHPAPGWGNRPAHRRRCRAGILCCVIGGFELGLPATLGLVGATLLLAVVAVRVSTRIGLPSLLLYLGIGLLLGESGLGIQFDDAALTQQLGLTALVLILAEGGLTTRWSDVRPGVGVGLVLSTAGVAASTAVTGGALHWLVDLEWRTALLWGAVLSSTDAAAVFSVLRGARVPRRLAGTLELESGLNDAPAYIAVVLLASAGTVPWWSPLLGLYQLAAGGVIGIAFGWLGSIGLRRAALPATGLYPVATISVCVVAFALAQGLGVSGLLAAFLAGLVLGNSRLPHRAGTLSFAEGLGWLSQIGLFVMLGLYASPSRLPAAILPALVTGAVLLLLARPVSVLVSAAPFRVPWREQVFLSWSGLRGAVPVVLALVAVSQGADGGQRLVEVVLVLVVVLTVLQGSTLSAVARWLRLSDPAGPAEIEVDAAPLEQIGADLLQLRVPTGSKLHGVYLSDLRLPRGATTSLVVRDGAGFTPQPSTRLQEGDGLLVVTTTEQRAATERRIRAVHRAGRLARWLGETGR
ncbi:MAG: potassium/proton antiporter [Pseudonocardiaceae bacterium]|nr:potassium/proton antiporter [Pseudonocardiaceae bacterium]